MGYSSQLPPRSNYNNNAAHPQTQSRTPTAAANNNLNININNPLHRAASPISITTSAMHSMASPTQKAHPKKLTAEECRHLDNVRRLEHHMAEEYTP